MRCREAAAIATSVPPPPYEDGPVTPTDTVSSAPPSLPPRRESNSDIKVRVIYDFDGQQPGACYAEAAINDICTRTKRVGLAPCETRVAPGDLRLRQGELITVLSQEGDWWEGILNGERGYFPANYVENV